MAAFVASCCAEGEAVSREYCALAEQWASALEAELTKLQELDSTSSGHAELKAKICMCHYLVVIAVGCSAVPGTVALRNLDPYTSRLCKHMLLV